MATRRQVLARVKELGCTFSENEYDMYVDAPPGFVFGCSPDLTCLKAPWSNGAGHTWKSEAYGDLMDRLSYGLEPAEESVVE